MTIFNEKSLRAAIVGVWGEYGAHAEAFDMIERNRADLLKQRDELAAMLKELIDKDTAMREHFGNRWPCDLDVTAQRASALLASLKKDS